MACPICDQKPANCDCTPEERRQYAEIGDLEDEVAALRAKVPQWIPVSERLPEPDYMGNAVGVLACLPDGEVCIGFCDNDEYGVRWQCQSTQKPTHWMPLPEPPNDAL